MRKQFLSALFLCLLSMIAVAQNDVKSTSLWQIENLANGKNGTFSLLIMNDESCRVSLTTQDNVYQSKNCVLGSTTVKDYDGNIYQLDFSSTENFGVQLTLKGKKTVTEYRSFGIQKINTPNTSLPPAKPKETIAQIPEKTTPKVIPKENTKIKEKEIKVKEGKVKTVKEVETVQKPVPAVAPEVKKEQTEKAAVASSSSRKVIYQPEAVNVCAKVYGTIVFDVTVNPNGRVISSKINIGQSKNPTSCLVSNAIELLQQMRWETIQANYEEDLEVTFAFEKEEKKKKKK